METSAAARAIGDAARRWLDALDEDQRANAVFPFDSDERSVWAYTPEPPRRGLALGDMRPAEVAAARAIVAASMSARGAGEVAAVIELEPVLGELERASGRLNWRRRDPGRYWFAVFGEPGSAAPWSWRVGGHHVAIHLTVAGDEVVGAAPSFLGANPALVPSGSRAGMRALPGEEALARALLAALSPTERDVAIVSSTAPADIRTGNDRHADVRRVPGGIRLDALSAAARDRLERLVRHYVDRVRRDVADATWDRLVTPDLDHLTFAWAGSEDPGRGHYYAVRGPRFLIEYDNTQDGANHIHAVWRELANDWGEDLLAEHLASHHGRGG